MLRLHWSPDGLSSCSFVLLCFYGSGNNNAEPPLGTAGSNTRPFKHPSSHWKSQSLTELSDWLRLQVTFRTANCVPAVQRSVPSVAFEKEGGKAERLHRSLTYCEKETTMQQQFEGRLDVFFLILIFCHILLKSLRTMYSEHKSVQLEMFDSLFDL